MRIHTVGLALVLSGAGFAASAQAAPPQWTILREQCWHISATAGQCAVGLFGTFATRQECLATNGGQVEQKSERQGLVIASRCEMLLQE